MQFNHHPMTLDGPWTLQAQLDYQRAIANRKKITDVRASGNALMKFVRKAFTYANGKSVVNWFEIKHFESISFPAFIYDVAGGQKGTWDLETPQMTNFNWREYLSTFP